MEGVGILGISIVFGLFFVINPVFADSVNAGDQVSLSEDLQNNPLAQDILKKIDQTKKMIEELKQKEYEMNQAQENLEKMRDMSIKQLTNDLAEWERQWDRFSSRNVFDNFVSNKPGYVQGVFWDQFEFKEQKVNAGRIAMNNILMNGGTMQEATNAYHKIATAPKIELIEMNSQFNVKHNLADYAEQQIFNSTGQVHMSSTTQSKLNNLYSDYKLQPNYILANSDDKNKSELSLEINADTECADGLALVSRITTGAFSCVDESIVKKWIDNGIKGIKVHDESLSKSISSVSNVKVNPGTKCDSGYQVIYNVVSLEYQCVLESVAAGMISDNTGEIHTLTEYVLSKDKQKINHDEIYEINQKILQINAEFGLKKSILESKYDEMLDDEKLSAKQKMQEIIKGYKIDENITKEDVTRLISEVRAASDSNKEKIGRDKTNELDRLELELKNSILRIVKGHENNPDIDVDWDYLNESQIAPTLETEEKKTNPIKVSLHENYSNKIQLDNIDLVNSFGHKFDEIKSEQVLQVAADITNFENTSQNFIYMVEVKNNDNITVQPAKWVTGTLNSNQTLNVGLSWIPKDPGQYLAILSTGTEMNSVSQVADIQINVNLKGDISDYNYCKNGYELLFKYTDNSPICASPTTASKLINIGLAFA